MLLKGDFLHSRLWVVFAITLLCILWLPGTDSFAQSNAVRLSYIPPEIITLRSQGSVDSELEMAAQALRQRQDPQLTATMLARVAEDVQRTQNIRATQNTQVEELKSRQILWQSEQARQDMDQILRFHVETSSDVASRLQWFWSNHFNVFGMKRNVKLLLADYDSNAISPKLVGRFGELLQSAVLHPAMVMYLDNSSNRKSKGNENLAREILELHTLGVDGGYSQADVQNLARALTGVTVAGFRAGFKVDECQSRKCVVIDAAGTVLERQHHDDGVKMLLGKKYQRDDGLEILEMLDDLANHPSTARHLSRKLIQYFIMDEPDPGLVDRLASVYSRTNGDLMAVYRALFSSSSRLVSNPDRFSDPFTYLMRVSRILRQVGIAADYTLLNKILRDWGQGIYQRVTPDGYPLESTYWSGAAAIAERLDTVDQLLKTGDERVLKDRIRSIMLQVKPHLLKSTQKLLTKYEDQPATWLAYFLVSPEIVF